MRRVVRSKNYVLKQKEYVIEGTPIPWKRAGLKGKQFYDRQKWDKIWFANHMQQQHGDDPMFTGPLHVTLRYLFPIPASIPKRAGSIWHTYVPDIDNLTKFAYDAITDAKVVWHDDRIVCSCDVKKQYHKEALTYILIREIE